MVSQELLDSLRCPIAVHNEGDDPGHLDLVRDYWLVSPESGYKYPIIDDIPIMLVEVGEKYKDIAIDDLPVPPSEDAIPSEQE